MVFLLIDNYIGIIIPDITTVSVLEHNNHTWTMIQQFNQIPGSTLKIVWLWQNKPILMKI